MSATKAEVSDLIKANNDQLMASFKELLKDTARQIKRANETSKELQMKEIEELKFQEPHKFKSKANEDQYKLNLKTCGVLRQRQVHRREDQPWESEVQPHGMWEIPRWIAKRDSSCRQVWIRLEYG